MRLALAQVNPKVGALGANAELIGGFVTRARGAGADLVVFPELVLCGYPPRDLLLQQGFVQACVREAKRVGESQTGGITAVFGLPLPVEGTRRVANALVVYRDNAHVGSYHKRLLPTYDVFDEDRYFVPGERAVIIEVAGVRVGLSICEDLWRGEDAGFSDRYFKSADPVGELVRPPGGGAGAQVIVNPSASPFRLGIGARHRALLKQHAMRHGVYIAAVNQVGGNDELVFDGSACVFGPSGEMLAAGPSFVEALTVVDIPAGVSGLVVDQLTTMAEEEALWHALVLGVRDYCNKTGFKSAVLGLSGGIDSAVVGVIASAALGAGNVLGVSLPSRYSSQGSRDDARELAGRLGVRFETIGIEEGFVAVLGMLAPAFAGRAADVTEENLQSRIRGMVLMGLSNKFGGLLLTTGNKSELGVGYCTLYGDMNGGLAVISDVSKMMVYRLARWCNENWQRLGIAGLSGPPIPQASISKPPSAELRPGQTDQDSLPAYEVLDEILRRRVELRQSAAGIVEAMRSGPVRADEQTIRRLLRLVDISEFKRRQSAIGLKVTGVAFGSGRRMPIAQGYGQ